MPNPRRVSVVVPTVKSTIPVIQRVLAIHAQARVHVQQNHSVFVVCYKVTDELWNVLNPAKVLRGLGRLDYEEYFLIIAHEDGISIKRLWLANSLLTGEKLEELADRLAAQISENYLGEEYAEHAQLIPANQVNSDPIKVSETGQIT